MGARSKTKHNFENVISTILLQCLHTCRSHGRNNKLPFCNIWLIQNCWVYQYQTSLLSPFGLLIPRVFMFGLNSLFIHTGRPQPSTCVEQLKTSDTDHQVLVARCANSAEVIHQASSSGGRMPCVQGEQGRTQRAALLHPAHPTNPTPTYDYDAPCINPLVCLFLNSGHLIDLYGLITNDKVSHVNFVFP